MSITKKESKKLKAVLPRGWSKIIAEKTGVHVNTVLNVMNRGHDNLEVYEAIVILAEQTAKLNQRIRNRALKIPS